MHRIEIKNFGPIKHFEADINDLMFFIGPQASGKSTISKIIFFCRQLHDMLYLSFEEITVENLARLSQPIDVFYLHLKGLANKYFSEVKGEFIYHINLQYYVHVQIFADDIEIIISEALKVQLSPLSEEFKLFRQETQTTIKYQEIRAAQQIFSANIRKKLFELFEDNRFCMFIPAGREGIARFAKQSEMSDPPTQAFWHFLQYIKKLSNVSIEQWLEMAKRSGKPIDVDEELFSFAVKESKKHSEGRISLSFTINEGVTYL